MPHPWRGRGNAQARADPNVQAIIFVPIWAGRGLCRTNGRALFARPQLQYTVASPSPQETWIFSRSPSLLPVPPYRTDPVGPGPQTRKNCVWEPDPSSGVIDDSRGRPGPSNATYRVWEPSTGSALSAGYWPALRWSRDAVESRHRIATTPVADAGHAVELIVVVGDVGGIGIGQPRAIAGAPRRYGSVWGSYAARRLNEIVVLLNKRDQIDNGESDELRQAVRQVLNQYLSVPLGVERVSSIPILDCVSVQTGRGTTLIDGVIAQLTERLAP